MASTSGGASSSKPPTPPAAPPRKPSVSAKATADPVLRNALRYTISAREYALLHKYVLSRSRVVKKRAPSVDTVQRIMHGDGPAAGAGASRADKASGKGKEPESAPPGVGAVVGADDFNARAVRHSLRVFLTTATLMKLGGLISARFSGQKKE